METSSKKTVSAMETRKRTTRARSESIQVKTEDNEEGTSNKRL